MEKHARPSKRVKTPTDASAAQGVRSYLLFFFPQSIIPVLFTRSECRCTVTVTSNAPYRPRGWQCRNFSCRGSPPFVPGSLSPIVSSSSSSSFLAHSFPRARLFILANVLSLPRGRYTTRVFNLVHLIVGFVGAFVRATCSYLGRQSITSSRSRRTRTLLSPYVNELLIFRASDLFFFFFFFSLSFPPPSPIALYHFYLIFCPPRAHDTSK